MFQLAAGLAARDGFTVNFDCLGRCDWIHNGLARLSAPTTTRTTDRMRNISRLCLTLSLASLLQMSSRTVRAADPQVLPSGATVGPISGTAGSMAYYRMTITGGATSATFALSGGTGDCDLYVRFGALPTRSVWDYRPYTATSTETVSVASPTAGDWYVMLRGYTAYANVRLKFQQDGGGSGPLVAATPTFSPAPGTYSGQVSVSLSTMTPNPVIRFTRDGSTPTDGSENYTAPLIVSATTTIRAIAFAAGYSPSGEVSGTFAVQNALATLANDTPVTNLSGALRSVENFLFAVPPGRTRVTFFITGSSGDCDLYVKYGQLATTSVWDRRPYTATSNETVDLLNPAAGDYYVMLHGYSAYSGVTLTARSTGGGVGNELPDLTIRAEAISPRITTETFAASACAVQEGLIPAGTRRLLRFSLETRNIGTADLVLGDPQTNPRYVFAPCHGHYHFLDFARYRLLNTTGDVLRTSQKIGFCLEDLSRWDAGANPSARYTCDYQGIQAGWSDVYSSAISGQWIDITGLAAGTYVLEATVDPTNLLPESNETNNTVQRTVTIP